MKILVIGGNGKVGKPLVENLVSGGLAVRVLTRSAERAAALDERVEGVVADIANDPLASGAAFDGVDTVFMLNQPTVQETVEGLFAVELARIAGVSRFVYQSVFRVEELAYLPHVAPKLVIQRAVMQSGMRWTILSPNHFFQNDLLSRTSLLERSQYSVPVGAVGCSSVDAGDIAAAAVVVLTGNGHDGKNYSIVGAEALTARDCADTWGKALGTPVKYLEDVQLWRESLPPIMPAWLKFDLSLMYEDFGRRGFVATEQDVACIHELLGREPTRYQSYVLRQAGEWRQD
jgi:uncharacterized protein YbjT (DUF2867 family)